MSVWCPIGVRLDLARLCDPIFQHRHRIPNFVIRSFDVVVGRRADVRVTQDSLNHLLRHSQAVQVAPKATPGSVPTVPLGSGAVPLVFVIRSLMVYFWLPAALTAVQGRKNASVHDTG